MLINIHLLMIPIYNKSILIQFNPFPNLTKKDDEIDPTKYQFQGKNIIFGKWEDLRHEWTNKNMTREHFFNGCI